MKFYILFKVLSVRLLALWALTVMQKLEPNTPYKDTYAHTADVFARSAVAHPLYAGEDGARRTLATYIGLTWFESRFDPKAKGDGECLETKKKCETEDNCKDVCIRRGTPNSFCLGQVNRSNFAGLGVTEETLLEGEKNADGSVKRTGTEVCVDAMQRMMKRSFDVCAGRPLEDRLAWYAAGGDGCVRGFRESGNRIRKAQWVFSSIPVPEEPANVAERF